MNISLKQKKWLLFSGFIGVFAVCVIVLVIMMASRNESTAANLPGDNPMSTPNNTSTHAQDLQPLKETAPKPVPDVVESVREDVQFMKNLRTMWPKNPQAALPLALEGEQHFENTPLAAECAWIAVRCLTEMTDFSKAREKSREMLEKYPDTHWTMDVRRHLLSHPVDE